MPLFGSRYQRPARTFVIAEAGVNHNGSLELAKQLVDAAADAGADAVKFQTFSAEALASADAPKAEYQQETTGESGSQLEMLRALELSADDHRTLVAYCQQRGIEFMSAPFDMASIDLLGQLGLKRVKVPSGELTNVPYLRRVAALGLPVIVSTGMATLDEVRSAVAVLEGAGVARDAMVVLHCTTEYPAPAKDVNLLAMVSIRVDLGVRVGYSDHTEGITVPVAAVALGAEVIEKHLTTDRNLPGPDHRASLEPVEFKVMVHAIREAEFALGDGIKRPGDAEMANAAVARKSIVAAVPIAKGDVLSESNLTVKRPGTGISPLRWDEVVGTVAARDYAPDERIEEPS